MSRFLEFLRRIFRRKRPEPPMFEPMRACTPAMAPVNEAHADARPPAVRSGIGREIHYMLHHRKARIRKKYRNRMLRRAHRDERRIRYEENTEARA